MKQVQDRKPIGGGTQSAAAVEVRADDLVAAMDRFESPLLRYVGQMLGHGQAETEDVVQEAFIRLHRQVTDRGVDSIAKLSTWLYRVAHNLAIDALRRRGTQKGTMHGEAADLAMIQHAAESGEGLDSLGEMIRQEACERAMAELHRLPEPQRSAITLKVLEGMTMRQIAEVLEMAPSNVCYHVNQGLATLAQRLKSGGVI